MGVLDKIVQNPMQLLKLFSDGLSELTFIECGENGPYDMNAPKVHTLGKVQKVSITDCSWGKTILCQRRDDLWIIQYGLLWDKNRINRDLVGSTCGLIRGKTNSIYIEYTMDNIKDKFNGKKVKKFPKKQETKDGGPLATIDICGHIPVINPFHFRWWKNWLSSHQIPILIVLYFNHLICNSSFYPL